MAHMDLRSPPSGLVRTHRIRWTAYLIPALLLVLRVASSPTADLAYLLLAGYALLGRRQVIRAMVLLWLFTLINPGIAPSSSAAGMMRYLVILAAAASIFFRSLDFSGRILVRPVTLLTFFIGVFIVIHSLLFSPYPDISILKGVNWTMAMMTVVSAWLSLSREERDAAAREVYAFLVALMITSVPLLVVPTGFLTNGTGFQGVLNQPQPFGVVAALTCVWALSALVQQARPSWSQVGVAGLALVLAFLSEARTALVSLILGLALALVTTSILSGRPLKLLMPGLRSPRVHFTAMMVIFTGALLSPWLADRISSFVLKRTESSSLSEAYANSRGRLIEDMLENIEAYPLTGIGFGIASDPFEMEVARDPVLGLPLSVPIEKGVMPVAVFEELGVFGFALVGFWIFVLLRSSAFGGVSASAVVYTALLSNMGENVLFSPGGAGLILLVLLGWGFACGDRRHHA